MTGPYLAGALEYLNAGWSPIPVDRKKPLVNGHHGKAGRYAERRDVTGWAAQFPDANIGLRLRPDVIGLDVDHYGDKDGAGQLAKLEAEFGALPAGPSSTSRGDGPSRIRFFRVPADGRWWRGSAARHIEVIHYGNRYAVVAPSVHPEGREYRWYDAAGEPTPELPTLADLPELPAPWVAYLTATEPDHLPGNGPIEARFEPGAAGDRRGLAILRKEITRDWRARGDEFGWNNALFSGSKALFELVAGGHLADEPTRLALVQMALDAGMYAECGAFEQRNRIEATVGSGREHGLAAPRVLEDREQDEDKIGALPDGHRPTDAGNAARLVEAAGDRIRYVHFWGKWLVYRDGAWRVDPAQAELTEIAKQIGRSLFRLAADQADSGQRKDIWKHATQSETKGAVAAMITMARGDGRVLIEHEALDRHPMILNAENGEIDLETGELRPHEAGHLLTLQAPTPYDPEATSELWDRCLAQWQPDPDVRWYLQKAVGSGLTGRAVERLFINIGQGGNGKSKFYGAVKAALGSGYYVIPHKSLLVAQRHESHPTHLASLYGARIVVAAETGDGHWLNEDGVKNLTGGDPLRARRMREDEWTFDPTWTAFMHTNHLPSIRGTDDGVWRRIRAIRWGASIPQAAQNERLADDLAELETRKAILAWLVRGAVGYLKEGLNDEPEAIRRETEDYRASQNSIGRFLLERTRRKPGARTAPTEMYTAYVTWCADADEEPEPLVDFGKRMKVEGIVKINRQYKGIEITPVTPELEYGE